MSLTKQRDKNVEEDPYKVHVDDIQSFIGEGSLGSFESPIDISLNWVTPIPLHPLQWTNYNMVPKKLKITNTGQTCVISAKWNQERPFLVDGPLLGSYVFSQMHFHWGPDENGSDHTVDGESLPLELHVIHFKSVYLTQESALRERDGIACLVYFFQLQPSNNPRIQVLIDAISFVRNAHTSARLEPQSLTTLFRMFKKDYFLYWGSVTTVQCQHIILWFICREAMGISREQLDQFRTMYNGSKELITRNSRDTFPLGQRLLYHVLPSDKDATTLFPPHEGLS